MTCKICGEAFYMKRGLFDLFDMKEVYICNKCYKKYPIDLSFLACQLDKYKCIIIPMCKKRY